MSIEPQSHCEDLTALERAEQLNRKETIFNSKGGSIRPTSSGAKHIGFAQDTADAIGLSKTTINRALRIVDGIPEKIRDEIRGTNMAD